MYKDYRNSLTKLIKITKVQYYKKKVDEAKVYLRKTWNNINEATDCGIRHRDQVHHIKN